MQILLPAIPVIKETFQVSAEVAQLTLSLSMFAIAIGTLAYGPLSDRYGRKPIMLIGLAITFAGSLFCYAAQSIEMLIVGRIIQAFGGAVGLVLARAIVRDVYGPEQAAKVIATLVMVMVVMPMLSPAVGGEVMTRFGWEAVFLVMSALSLLIFLILQSSLTETLAEPAPFDGVGAMLRNFIHLMRSRAFRGYALCRLRLGRLLRLYFSGSRDHDLGVEASRDRVRLLLYSHPAWLHAGQFGRAPVQPLGHRQANHPRRKSRGDRNYASAWPADAGSQPSHRTVRASGIGGARQRHHATQRAGCGDQ